jgi:hypothetical protein
MLWCPAARRQLIAKLRKMAMFSGPCSVWTLEASSRKALSLAKWSRFSISHCERMIFASRCGEAFWLVRSVMTQTVPRLRLPVFRQCGGV